MCFDILYKIVWNILHSKKNERDVIKSEHSSSGTVPVILGRFN